jgi:hypothetical protein
MNLRRFKIASPLRDSPLTRGPATAPTMRRHRSDSTFHDLQQRLLNALSRNIATDRDVRGLAADLVDLIDINDAALCALDIVIGRLQQLEDDVLDVLPDVAGFR